MKTLLYFSIFVLFCVQGYGQDGLFGFDSSIKVHHGFILTGNLSADLPMADMAKRFGVSYRIGPAITYKTKKNWLWGTKFDFIVGNTIKEDSLMINIRDKYSGDFNGKVVQMLNNNGERTGVTLFERGYAVGVYAGKIINFNHANPDNGLTLLTTAGFMQHKINIFNREGDVPQVRGDYKKGYDRLTNGFFIEQFVGYSYFAENGLLNFNFGIDALWGFTQGRRDYLYDVGRPDDKKRSDVLIGIRAGWMIPMFKRKSEDLSF